MKIGIIGGTFDPIHTGHIQNAVKVAKEYDLDFVYFVPGGEAPHKLDRRITPGEDRVKMAELSIQGIEKLKVSTYETDKKEYSFSIDTVKHFKEEFPEAELFFIIGSDVVGELKYWKDIDELFTICSFIALKRPGCDEKKFADDVKENNERGGRVLAADDARVDISSDRIRKAIKEKGYDAEEAVNYLAPAALEYIRQNELYIKDFPFDEEYALSNMKARLKPERFQHCLRVSDEAVRIAREFGFSEEDIEKCRIAGLFHDCGKEVSMEQLYWLDPKLQEEALPENGGSMKVIHGPAGALIARKKYGIIDPVILEAIRCHVTGSPDMGPVAQVVFLADYTEPGRDDEALQNVREYLKTCPRTVEGLADAIVNACDSSIAYVRSKNDFLCPASLATREAFNKKRSKRMTPKETAALAASVMDDRKAKEIETIDITGRTAEADYFVICSGTSNTHVKAIADEVEFKLKEAGIPIKHIEGYDTATWILLDFGDIVCHVFREEERQFYNLERLWSKMYD